MGGRLVGRRAGRPFAGRAGRSVRPLPVPGREGRPVGRGPPARRSRPPGAGRPVSRDGRRAGEPPVRGRPALRAPRRGGSSPPSSPRRGGRGGRGGMGARYRRPQSFFGRFTPAGVGREPKNVAERPSPRRDQGPPKGPLISEKPGGDLLSRGVSPQVPSARAGLTSVFGTGTGVAPPPWPPETGAAKGISLP
jgi:hypothetical protein